MDIRGVYAVMSDGLTDFLASCRGVCRFHLAHTHTYTKVLHNTLQALIKYERPYAFD